MRKYVKRRLRQSIQPLNGVLRHDLNAIEPSRKQKKMQVEVISGGSRVSGRYYGQSKGWTLFYDGVAKRFGLSTEEIRHLIIVRR